VNLIKHAELKGQVDLKLCNDDVAYNTSVNKTINERSHDEIAYDCLDNPVTLSL